MFEGFYNLRADPFRLTPDPHFAFGHPTYAKALAYMRYALESGEGFVLITGSPGTGKTTLIEDVLGKLEMEKVLTARLTSTQVEADDLLRLVGYSFGLEVEGADKATVLRHIERFLREQAQDGRRVLLIVDEAQGLDATALEELRLLANLQAGTHPLVQVFLLGQEKLRDVMGEPGMEQLHQRIVAACHLTALNAEQTQAYIEHRLRRAGWSDYPTISLGAYRLVFSATRGIPRRINLVAGRLLLHGSVEQKYELGGEDVRLVVQELHEELAYPAMDDAVLDAGHYETLDRGGVDPPEGTDVSPSALPEVEATQVQVGRPPELAESPDESRTLPAEHDEAEAAERTARAGRAAENSHTALAGPCVAVCVGDRRLGTYRLRLGKTLVGRVAPCDLVIEDKFISRTHVELECSDGGRVILRDLDSTNGTWVEGKRVHECELHHGQRVRLGTQAMLRFLNPRRHSNGSATGSEGGRDGSDSGQSPGTSPAPVLSESDRRTGGESLRGDDAPLNPSRRQPPGVSRTFTAACA
jgi:putative secretion ATPase (PEP-CTERM system associated)